MYSMSIIEIKLVKIVFLCYWSSVEYLKHIPEPIFFLDLHRYPIQYWWKKKLIFRSDTKAGRPLFAVHWLIFAFICGSLYQEIKFVFDLVFRAFSCSLLTTRNKLTHHLISTNDWIAFDHNFISRFSLKPLHFLLRRCPHCPASLFLKHVGYQSMLGPRLPVCLLPPRSEFRPLRPLQFPFSNAASRSCAARLPTPSLQLVTAKKNVYHIELESSFWVALISFD